MKRPPFDGDDEFFDERVKRYVATMVLAGYAAWNAFWLYAAWDATKCESPGCESGVGFLLLFWIGGETLFIVPAVRSLWRLFRSRSDDRSRLFSVGVGLFVIGCLLGASIVWTSW